jgi:two-component system, chemotaxis family, CheB/CheR fusion protein
LVEQAMLRKISPVAILVEENGNILYLHGKTGSYLEIPEGEIGVNNIFTMVDESIKDELLQAIKKVKVVKTQIDCNNISVKINGHYRTININVSQILNPVTLNIETSYFYLIMFEEMDALNSTSGEPGNTKSDLLSHDAKSVDDLRDELKVQEKFLQDANERQEITNQELRSFNEEMQSLNEELQSTNEELETSREELQSVNEELSTVNVELQEKITELTRSNNDMNNLVSGTGIGTVFVDHDLNILRFTPEMKKIINLIKSDIGRPLGDIVSNFVDYRDLIIDVQSVLDSLIPIEYEVEIVNDLWFKLKILPYRTVDNIIEGAVISFMEITESVKTRHILEETRSTTYLAKIINDSNDAIIMHNLDGKIMAWNSTESKMYGWSESEALEMNISSMIPTKLKDSDLKKREEMAMSPQLEPYMTKRIKKDGDTLNVMITLMPIVDSDSNLYAISTTERSID